MTENQKKLLKFINEYQINYGISPTLREIVEGIGISDKKSAHNIVSRLVDMGYLKKQAKKSRSISLTQKALRFLAIFSHPVGYGQKIGVFNDYIEPTAIMSRSQNDVKVVMPTTDVDLIYQPSILEVNGTS